MISYWLLLHASSRTFIQRKHYIINSKIIQINIILFSNAPVTALIGASDISNIADTIPVSRTITHEQYNPETEVNDIALAVMSRPPVWGRMFFSSLIANSKSIFF